MDEKLALADKFPTEALFILEYQMQTFAYNEYEFEKIFHPKYFTCFVFNKLGNQILTNSQDGVFSLLFTGVYQEQTNYNPNFIQPDFNIIPGNTRGIYVFIQNSSDYLLGTDRSPLLITPSYYTKLSINRQFYKQYPWPYSECAVLEDNSLVADFPLKDRFVFNEVVAVTHSYTRKTCLSFCAQLTIVRRCGCKSSLIGYDVPHANVSCCSMSDELGCAARVWHAIDEINGECLPKCPLECWHMSFDVTQNINTWKDIEYFSIRFPSDISQATLEANAVHLDIMYDDFAFVETLEVLKMSGEDLLAVIGGHLHLFLGMSLLSFVEVIELLVLNLTRTGEQSRTSTIPNAVRAPHRCLALFWLAMFVCSFSTRAFFIISSVQQYNRHEVTTTLEHSHDHTIAIRFCQQFWTTSELAVAMLTELGLLEQKEQRLSLIVISEYFKRTRGSYLNQTELDLYGDVNRAVVHCDINGKPCESVFKDGCIRVFPRYRLGNTITINPKRLCKLSAKSLISRLRKSSFFLYIQKTCIFFSLID